MKSNEKCPNRSQLDRLGQVICRFSSTFILCEIGKLLYCGLKTVSTPEGFSEMLLCKKTYIVQQCEILSACSYYIRDIFGSRDIVSSLSWRVELFALLKQSGFIINMYINLSLISYLLPKIISILLNQLKQWITGKQRIYSPTFTLYFFI